MIRWRRLLPSFGYGGCFRCGRTWRKAEWHLTPYENTRGMFPLCERCWAKLTPEQRLPFYRELFEQWRRQAGSTVEALQRFPSQQWEQIQEAVLAGR